jgi:hypothetical protein
VWSCGSGVVVACGWLGFVVASVVVCRGCVVWCSFVVVVSHGWCWGGMTWPWPPLSSVWWCEVSWEMGRGGREGTHYPCHQPRCGRYRLIVLLSEETTTNNDIVVCCLVATSMTWHLFRCQKGIWGCAYPGWTWRDVPCVVVASCWPGSWRQVTWRWCGWCSDGVSDMAVGEWRGNGQALGIVEAVGMDGCGGG